MPASAEIKIYNVQKKAINLAVFQSAQEQEDPLNTLPTQPGYPYTVSASAPNGLNELHKSYAVHSLTLVQPLFPKRKQGRVCFGCGHDVIVIFRSILQPNQQPSLP